MTAMLGLLGSATVVLAGIGGALAWVRLRWMMVDVEGPSMLPTLAAGDRIRVRRAPPATVRLGDVVVAERPPPGPRRLIVKRVVAVPGDRAPSGVAPWSGPGGGTVPDGTYVLLGDNPADSYDSRVFGYIPAERIVGVAPRSFRTPPAP